MAVRVATKSLTWSAAQSHGFPSYAVGNLVDLGIVVTAYPTFSKALGLSLRLPDSVADAKALYPVTETICHPKSVP